MYTVTVCEYIAMINIDPIITNVTFYISDENGSTEVSEDKCKTQDSQYC